MKAAAVFAMHSEHRRKYRAQGEPSLSRKGTADMRLLIALILPWLTFFTIGRPIAGIICLILQITLIGWLPATIWAVYAVSQYNTDRKIEKALGQRN
ncbi:YqaE/Pmp3 family membrane protein [Phytopseudomonas seleniipraecipitans]|nr:YqaE/Pmp3 family membrane protein [Pseudomonas seleniipraecipitans]